MKPARWMVFVLVCSAAAPAFAQGDPFAVQPNQGAPVVVVVPAYPTATVDPGAMLLQELSLLREQYRHYRLGGPIALMATGFAGSLILLVTGALVASSQCWNIWDSCEDDFDNQIFRRYALASLGLAALGVGGLVWMIRRMRDRRPIGRRIREIRLQLRDMGIRSEFSLDGLSVHF